MRRQFAPLDFRWIFLVDLAQPAFIRTHITRATRWAWFGAVHDYNLFVSHPAGHAEGRSAGERRCLGPCISLNVINLYIVHRGAGRAAADQVNETIMDHSSDGAIYGHRY